MISRDMKGGLVGAVVGLALASGASAQEAFDLLDAAGNQAVEEQRAGDYGTMERTPLGAIQSAWDGAPDESGVVRFSYGREKTYKMRLREGMAATLVLPRWDEIADVVYGSDLVEEIKRGRNTVSVQAREAGADTNITVFMASGAIYHFYARTEGYNSANIPDGLVYVDRPAPAMVGGEAGRRPIRLVADGHGSAKEENAPGSSVPDFANPIVGEKLEFRYRMYGSRDLAPDVVFSDGRFTYLYWRPDRWAATEFPGIFRRMDEVDEPISNYEIVGTTVIVKELGRLTLLSGMRRTCIEPDSWTAGVAETQG